MVLVIVVALMVVAGELFLPWIVARGLEAGLSRALGTGAELEVSLSVRPALRMVAGRLDTLTLESKRVRTATLTIDSMAMTIRDISVNLQDLLRRQLDVTRSASIGTVFRISEGNLRRYVVDNVEGLSEPQFKVFAGRAALAGYMRFAGTPVLVSAEGRFVPRDEKHVMFRIDTLAIDNEQLPDRLAATLIAALGGDELFIDLGRFPVPLAISQVKMTDGWLIIEAATPVR